MFSLESKLILAAIRRSLETHVLPDVSEGFVHNQVLAAMKSLEEIIDRIENGDPCARSNERLVTGLETISAHSSEVSPEFSQDVQRILEGLPKETGEPRDRYRALGQALSDFLSQSEAPEKWEIVKLLQGETSQTASEDQQWQCKEAIESLQ
jgi:hypothetical protein